MTLPRITKAVRAENFIWLTLTDLDEASAPVGEPYGYALYADDPYGLAPRLREELQRMVDAGEIVVEEPAP
jgi:hypothetical protein